MIPAVSTLRGDPADVPVREYRSGDHWIELSAVTSRSHSTPTAGIGQWHATGSITRADRCRVASA